MAESTPVDPNLLGQAVEYLRRERFEIEDTPDAMGIRLIVTPATVCGYAFDGEILSIATELGFSPKEREDAAL